MFFLGKSAPKEDVPRKRSGWPRSEKLTEIRSTTLECSRSESWNKSLRDRRMPQIETKMPMILSKTSSTKVFFKLMVKEM